MIEHSPDLLDAAQDSTDPTAASMTERERRWHDYALQLLRENITNNPDRKQQLSELEQTLLKSNQKSTMSGMTMDTGIDPDDRSSSRETRANFAQTRRRNIDRLRELFSRRPRKP